jgi:hypothetical protein
MSLPLPWPETRSARAVGEPLQYCGGLIMGCAAPDVCVRVEPLFTAPNVCVEVEPLFTAPNVCVGVEPLGFSTGRWAG